MAYRIVVDIKSKDEFDSYYAAAKEAGRLVYLLDERGFQVQNVLILDGALQCPQAGS